MRRFAKPLYALKRVPGVRIPPSPPESFNLPQQKDLAFPLFPLNYIIRCVKSGKWCIFGARLRRCILQ